MKQTDEFRAIAESMRAIDFCMMQTFDGGEIRSRPMSNNGDVTYDGTSWFFSRATSNKNREIVADDRVHLAFADPQTMSFISIWGVGTIITDVETKKAFWHSGLEEWFKDGPEDPDVTLVKVRAERIQTWVNPGEFDLNLKD